ncbi:uncharacterized protein LOC142489117 isoform X4 [Ascaphus truei]|uniref:uncharacterized protein LOC142489117 isoform X4 n=1 Tax=Ascaphus truei TaxID=8439 RepID=UPI003F5A9A50
MGRDTKSRTHKKKRAKESAQESQEEEDARCFRPLVHNLEVTPQEQLKQRYQKSLEDSGLKELHEYAPDVTPQEQLKQRYQKSLEDIGLKELHEYAPDVTPQEQLKQRYKKSLEDSGLKELHEYAPDVTPQEQLKQRYKKSLEDSGLNEPHEYVPDVTPQEQLKQRYQKSLDDIGLKELHEYAPDVTPQEQLKQRYKKSLEDSGLNEPHEYVPDVTPQEQLKQRYKKSLEDSGLNEPHEYVPDRQKSQHVAVRMGLSNHISRFQIPMDIKLLESMNVQDYLRNYCLVCKRRQTYYKKFFDKFDSDKDGIISSMEMEAALKDVYFNEINSEQVKHLMSVISAEENTEFDSKLFYSLCALSERLFYTKFVTEDTHDKYCEKPWVEKADFSAINWKLVGCDIDEALKRLLCLLSL